MSDMTADKREEQAMKETDIDQFSVKYANLILNLLQLQNGKIYTKVMDKVYRPVDQGYDWQKTIRMAVRKYKLILEDY